MSKYFICAEIARNSSQAELVAALQQACDDGVAGFFQKIPTAYGFLVIFERDVGEDFDSIANHLAANHNDGAKAAIAQLAGELKELGDSSILGPLCAQLSGGSATFFDFGAGAQEEIETREPDAATVAEWVGLHHGVNFDAENSAKQAEWTQRYIEMHRDVSNESGEADGPIAEREERAELVKPTAAPVTGRRIIGKLLKQKWGGRKGDDAIAVGEVEFDATNVILLLPQAELVELQDGSDNTDPIGLQHVIWDGPFEVKVTDSICEFFGVDDIRDVTAEVLAKAKADYQAAPAREQTITLRIKAKVAVHGDASTDDFVSELDYSVTSTTPGIVVLGTEITDAD